MHHENEKMALFEALYREYLVPLKKYAYRIGVGYDDIEDMVHEAFIEYYKRYSLDLDHKVKLVLLIRIYGASGSITGGRCGAARCCIWKIRMRKKRL